eukprot:3447897-Amphidinium_carterae.1
MSVRENEVKRHCPFSKKCGTSISVTNSTLASEGATRDLNTKRHLSISRNEHRGRRAHLSQMISGFIKASIIVNQRPGCGHVEKHKQQGIWPPVKRMER